MTKGAAGPPSENETTLVAEGRRRYFLAAGFLVAGFLASFLPASPLM
jgi:hypothetical protein